MFDALTILYNFWWAKRLMKQFRSRETLEDWQQKRLNKFMFQTFPKSPFYKEYSCKSFQDIPIVDKQIAMDNFDAINTVGVHRNDAIDLAREAEESRDFSPTIRGITVGLSSGTSGKQGLFLASRNERLKWAGIMLAKALPGCVLESHKIAFFLRANSNLYKTLSTGGHIQFRFFDLTDNLENSFELLNLFQPTIIVAPASVLRQIAQSHKCKGISIDPAKVFSVAEVLDPIDKRYIENAFSQAVHQIYQCTEGFLGITRNDGKLYLNEEYIYIEKEWIDRPSGRFVPIITDFSRKTQPIVRYRLDDVLVEDFSDTSPFTCLKIIEGRSDDICYFPSKNNGLKPIFADTLRQAMALSNVSFEEYKIIQHSPQNLELQFLPACSNESEAIVVKSIQQLCIKQNCLTPNVRFTSYRPNAPYQKLKRIERCFNLNS